MCDTQSSARCAVSVEMQVAFHMNANTENGYRAAGLVVSRVPDLLHIECDVETVAKGHVVISLEEKKKKRNSFPVFR